MINVAEILARVDIAALIGETVRLKKSGQEHYGICPFHADKSPTLRVNPTKGLWHCPSCQIGGDAISWLKYRDAIAFREAANSLAQRVGLSGHPAGPEPAQAPRLPKYPLQQPGHVPWGGQRLMTGGRTVLILHEFPGRRNFLRFTEVFPDHDIVWYPTLWDRYPQWKGSHTPDAGAMYLPPIVGCEIEIPPSREDWQERRTDELARIITRWRGYGIMAAARAGRIAS